MPATIRVIDNRTLVTLGENTAEAARQATRAAAQVLLASAEASLAETQADRAEAAADASVVATGNVFDSKADAEAALAALPANSVVEVLADESRSGTRTRYRKESGSLVFKITLGIKLTFPTLADFQASPVAPFADIAFILGYAVSGDGGRMELRKAGSSAPGHEAYHQHSNGTYWTIENQTLTPRMFGARPTNAPADNLQPLRRWTTACVQTKREGYGQRTRFPLDGNVYPGSLTSAPPAEGAQDGMVLKGLRIQPPLPAGGTCHIQMYRSKDFLIEDVRWDMNGVNAGGTTGGQIRATDCENFVLREIHKTRSDGIKSATGGSTITLDTSEVNSDRGCKDWLIDGCSNTAGSVGNSSSVVNGAGSIRGTIRRMKARNTWEGVDFSGFDDVVIDGFDLKDLGGEGFDIGCSSRITIRNGVARNLESLTNPKTETASGAPDGATFRAGQTGCNDILVENVRVYDFRAGVILQQAGATNYQTMQRHTYRNIRATSTVAIGSADGIKLVRGDASDEVGGHVLDDIRITMNDPTPGGGATISVAALAAVTIKQLRGYGKALLIAGNSTTGYRKKSDLVLDDVAGDGNIGLGGFFGMRWTDIEIKNGRILSPSACGLRARNIKVENASSHGWEFDIKAADLAAFGRGNDCDVEIDGYTNENNSVSTSGRYALTVVGDGNALKNFRMFKARVTTTGQASGRSGGFNFTSLTGITDPSNVMAFCYTEASIRDATTALGTNVGNVFED